MGSDISANVMIRIQKNPYCIARNTDSHQVLKLLMKHLNSEVRLATTTNHLMRSNLLSRLVKDKDRYVRYSVAIHPQTSLKDLVKLSNDKNKLVRNGALENVNFSNM